MSAKKPKTWKQALNYFASPGNSNDYLRSRRWPGGIKCPRCDSSAIYVDSSRDGWECRTRHPHRRFTLKTGTIFEDSALSLGKWLLAIWFVANAQDPPSSTALHRAIGVTQKTAWLMLLRIRLAIEHSIPD